MNIRHFFLSSFVILVVSFPTFADTQTWYFVRHFEKQLGANPSLTETGKSRAEGLAAFFSDKSLNHVYSTDYKRTIEAANPVAVFKKLPIKNYNPKKLVEFATKLKTLDQVLVVGHSNTTPQILSLVGGADIHMEESDYGVVYMLQKVGDKFTTRGFPISHK